MAKTSKPSSNKTKAAKKAVSARRGKFIVIDGIDGAGKATQAKNLVANLRARGKKVETIDFPQYHNNVFGKLIGECLAGQHGDFIGLDPKIASTLYAADRFESSKQIEKWLSEGKMVVADRYVSSNQIHQGGKCESDKDRAAFLNWLDTVEHGVFGIPRPDVIIYLSLPLEVSMSLINARNESTKKDKDIAKHRSYLKTGKANKAKDTKAGLDQAENNIAHLEASRQSALKIIKKKNNWKKIECFVKDTLLSKEVIGEAIVEIVEELL